MTTIIPVKNDEGKVYIEVIINGTPSWSYDYIEDRTIENDSTKDDLKKHLLGLPLQLEAFRHYWSFTLVNPSNFTTQVDIKIIWKQDQNDTLVELAKWEQLAITIAPNTPKEISSEGRIKKS